MTVLGPQSQAAGRELPECAWWGAGRGLTSEILYRGGRHFIRPILLRVENMRNLENGVKDDAVGVGVDGCRVLLL